MLKSKKSSTEITETLVILVVTIASLLLIVFPAYDRIKAWGIFNPNKAYLNSFNNFVDNINKISLPRDTFELSLKEKSAIVGFSKNADRYECITCGAARRTTIFDKPANEKECAGYACICLCNEFQLIGRMLNDKYTNFVQCSKLTCKKVEQGDIVNKVVIKTYTQILIFGGGAEYWKNGFLFVNGVFGANGLGPNKEERIYLIVEKNQNLIGVCNRDMLNFNKEEFNKKRLKSDGCITTE